MAVTREQLEALKASLDAGTGITTNLFFILKPKDDPDWEVTKTQINTEIAKVLQKGLAATIGRNLRDPLLEIRDYDPLYAHEVTTLETVALTELPMFEEIKDQVDNHDELRTAAIDTEFVKSLKAYLVTFTINGSTYYAFRRYARGKVLRAGLASNMMYRGGKLEKIEGDVFYVDKQVDCFTVNTDMVIVSKYNFELIFSLIERYKQLATEFLDKLRLRRIVANFNAFKQDCLSMFPKYRKVAQLAERVNVDELTYVSLRDDAADIESALTFDEQRQKITVPKEETWKFLKLVGDELLASRRTQEKFWVPSKTKAIRVTEIQ